MRHVRTYTDRTPVRRHYYKAVISRQYYASNVRKIVSAPTVRVRTRGFQETEINGEKTLIKLSFTAIIGENRENLQKNRG
jgi:hypothetical protein